MFLDIFLVLVDCFLTDNSSLWEYQQAHSALVVLYPFKVLAKSPLVFLPCSLCVIIIIIVIILKSIIPKNTNSYRLIPQPKNGTRFSSLLRIIFKYPCQLYSINDNYTLCIEYKYSRSIPTSTSNRHIFDD